MNIVLVTLLACTAPEVDSDTSVEADPLAPGFFGRLEVAYAVRSDISFAIRLSNADQTVTGVITVGHDDVIELAGVMPVGDGARIRTYVGTDLDISLCYDPYWEGEVDQELEASSGTVTVDFDAGGGTYAIDDATFEPAGEAPIVESATGVVDGWSEPCETEE